MGTSFRSLAIPARRATEIKSLVTNWLGAKGFQQTTAPTLFAATPFPRTEDNERGLCIFSSDQWTVLLYSHIAWEGERLMYELAKLDDPVLTIWCHDSDIWGYDLHKHGEILAAFHSNPRYFGTEEELPLPENGDPETLCAACHAQGKERDIERLQRRRAAFKENVCWAFCETLGPAPAGFAYRHLEEAMGEIPPQARIGDFDLEHLRFARGGGEEETPVRPLHARDIERAESASAQQDLPPEWQAYARRMRVFAHVLAIALWPLGLFFRIWFRFWFWLYRFRFVRERLLGSRWRYRFAELLQHEQRSLVRRDEDYLIHDRYRCRIRLPAGAEVLPGFSALWLFLFRLGGVHVMSQPHPPEAVDRFTRLPPQVTLIEDEKFFAGPYQARAIGQRMDSPYGVHHVHYWLVQTPRALFSFMVAGTDDVPAEIRATVRGVVESFRLIDESGASQG